MQIDPTAEWIGGLCLEDVDEVLPDREVELRGRRLPDDVLEDGVALLLHRGRRGSGALWRGGERKIKLF